MKRQVYAAEEVAELADLSTWAVYNATRREGDPLGSLAIRVGRRLLWPKTAVDRLLGIDHDAADIALTRPAEQEGRAPQLTDSQEVAPS